jgi:hypothetical protein
MQANTTNGSMRAVSSRTGPGSSPSQCQPVPGIVSGITSTTSMPTAQNAAENQATVRKSERNKRRPASSPRSASAFVSAVCIAVAIAPSPIRLRNRLGTRHAVTNASLIGERSPKTAAARLSRT